MKLTGISIKQVLNLAELNIPIAALYCAKEIPILQNHHQTILQNDTSHHSMQQNIHTSYTKTLY